MRTFPNRFPLTAGQLGMAVAVVSLTFFFGGLILAYGITIEQQRTRVRFELPAVLWWSTAFLILSSILLESARYALRRALVVLYRWRVGACLAFAILFLTAQLVAGAGLIRQGVAAAGNPHGAAYYVFMAVHAAHVTGGMLWLSILFWSARRLYQGTENDLRRHRRRAQAAAIYWHYMGLLWLVLFGFLHRWAA